MTKDLAQTIGSNEMGQVLVVMYHLIATPESEWTRTPENFRKDIALLKSEGFYPVNVRDLASGNIDIPAGKSPVVITFDDSSPGQYRMVPSTRIPLSASSRRPPRRATGLRRRRSSAFSTSPPRKGCCSANPTSSRRNSRTSSTGDTR
jgi:hypothetical protein